MEPTARVEPADLLQHAAFLRRIARGLLADDQRAEDVVQDVYATALERPPAHRTFLRGWLGRLTRNRALNVGRDERSRRTREAATSRPEGGDDQEAATESLEVQRLVCEQVLALDAEKRTAVHLRYYEGLTPAQIARRLDVPVKTVKSRLHRALGELRERLDRERGRSWALALLPLARGRAGSATLIAAGASLVAVALFVTVSLRTAGGHSTSVARSVDSTTALAVPLTPPAPAVETMPPTGTSRLAMETPPRPCTLVVDLRWETDREPAAALGMSAWSPDDPAPRADVRRVTSDEQGRVRLADLPPGKLVLRIDRGAEREVTLDVGETEMLEWLVPAGTDVEGIVRSAEGEPVADARLWCDRLTGDELVGWPVAVTDARGEFRVRGVGPMVCLVARARGYRPSHEVDVRTLPLGPGGARRAEIDLGPRAVSITGSVTDDGGQPVVGARVRAGSGRSACGAITDRHGDFELPSDLQGYADLVVVAPGFPVWSRLLDLEESELHVDVVLERPATVRGRVLSASGAAVVGASVQAGTDLSEPFPDRAMPRPRAVTDSDGRFVLGWMSSGENEILATTADPRDGRALVEVLCTAGAESTCELRLDPGRSITGRVSDREGRALAGWIVSDSPPFGERSAGRATTGDDGAFVLFGVAEGVHELEVTAPGELPVPPRASAHAIDGDHVEIVVANAEPARATIRGELRRRDGEAPADLSLSLRPVDARTSLRMAFDPVSGRFEHAKLLPGDYRLSVSRDGVTLVESESLTLAQDEALDVGTLWVELFGAVEVELTGEPPDPTAFLGLHLSREGSQSISLERYGNLFRAYEVPPGTWTVRGLAQQRYLHTVAVEVAAGVTKRAECRLSQAHDFVLTIRLAPADPMESELHLVIDDELGAALVDERYAMTPRVLTSAGGRVRVGKALDVVDAETRRLRLQLPPGAIAIRASTDRGRHASAVSLVDPSGTAEDEIVVR